MVDFITDDDKRLIGSEPLDFFNFFWCGLLVDDPKDNSGFRDFLVSTLYAKSFYDICGFADACGINKTESDTVDVDGVFYNIAGGAVNIGNNGALVVKELIEQSAFTNVGFANNCNRNALLDGLSSAERADETSDVSVDIFRELKEF